MHAFASGHAEQDARPDERRDLLHRDPGEAAGRLDLDRRGLPEQLQVVCLVAGRVDVRAACSMQTITPPAPERGPPVSG